MKFRSNINSEVPNALQRRKILLDSLAKGQGANYLTETAVTSRSRMWAKSRSLTISGRSRRVELGYGTTYLSPSARSITLTPGIQKIEMYSSAGRPTRMIRAND